MCDIKYLLPLQKPLSSFNLYQDTALLKSAPKSLLMFILMLFTSVLLFVFAVDTSTTKAPLFHKIIKYCITSQICCAGQMEALTYNFPIPTTSFKILLKLQSADCQRWNVVT